MDMTEAKGEIHVLVTQSSTTLYNDKQRQHGLPEVKVWAHTASLSSLVGIRYNEHIKHLRETGPLTCFSFFCIFIFINLREDIYFYKT